MLSDAKVRSAKPRQKPYKMSDGHQLYLYVSTAGGKLWRMNYQFNEKQRTLSLGRYPIIGLSEARGLRDEAKRQLLDGRDPALVRRERTDARLKRSKQTFEVLAREWHENSRAQWAKVHAQDVIHSLERDIFPTIGKLPVSAIDAPMLVSVLRKVEARGAIETAKRLRQRISAVFVYAIASGLHDQDPAALIGKALKPMPPKGKQPALLEISALQQVLMDADASGAHPVTRLALRLLALTAVRPGELRGAEWTEFEDIDGTDPHWRIPAARMKGSLQRKITDGQDHIVPLSSHAVQLLRILRPITGDGILVFPSVRHSHRPMSENAIGYLLNRAGYHGRHVPHGWRAAFSTLMNEWAKKEGRADDREIIDIMLAHVPPNKVESAYNRATYMHRRRELAQIWGDMLMHGMKKPTNLPFLPRK